MHPLLKTSLLVVFVVLLGVAGTRPAAAQSYSDNFEASSINPFWTTTEQYGTVSLSTDQHHGGAQSAKFSSSDGGQRGMQLTHVFPSPTKGNFSIYFYDAAPGQETLYEQFDLYNSSTTDLVTIGTQDFDAYCYTARLYNYNTGVQQGPNAPCGIYPQTSTANVSRTLGWHKLEVNVAANSVSLLIDGTQVFTTTGDYSFDTIDVAVSGPFWRPNTTAYFDDFSFTPLTESDPCEQQVQNLSSQVSALTQQNAALQAQVNDLTTQNGQLQQQVGALTAQNGQLQNQVNALTAANGQLSAQVSQLQNTVSQQQSQLAQSQSQLNAANQTIQSQQAQINQLQSGISALVGGVQGNFRTEFSDPQFTVPGGTPSAQLQNLLNAILNLNHGRKQGLYTSLGGNH